jgi:hypothetical protein
MENTFGYLKDTYQNGIIIATLIFLGVFLVRLWFVRKEINTRSLIWKTKAPALVWILKLIWLIAMLLFLLNIPTWFLSVASFKPLVQTLIYNSFLIVLISIAVMEIILSFTVTKSLTEQFIKRMLFLLMALFCLFSFGFAALIFKGTFNYPSATDCSIIEMPVKGKWLALHAGEKPWVNYHGNYPPQKFSIDMVKVDESRDFFKGMGENNTDFFCFNDSIFSPVNGNVVKIVNTFPNQEIANGPDTLNSAGNYIVIQMSENKYLFLSHLSPENMMVKEGDTIKMGSHLASLGNSGNSTFPHLHVRIQNKAEYNDSTALGLPFRFNQINRNRFGFWSGQGTPYLNRNDIFFRENE